MTDSISNSNNDNQHHSFINKVINGSSDIIVNGVNHLITGVALSPLFYATHVRDFAFVESFTCETMRKTCVASLTYAITSPIVDRVTKLALFPFFSKSANSSAQKIGDVASKTAKIIVPIIVTHFLMEYYRENINSFRDELSYFKHDYELSYFNSQFPQETINTICSTIEPYVPTNHVCRLMPSSPFPENFQVSQFLVDYFQKTISSVSSSVETTINYFSSPEGLTSMVKKINYLPNLAGSAVNFFGKFLSENGSDVLLVGGVLGVVLASQKVKVSMSRENTQEPVVLPGESFEGIEYSDLAKFALLLCDADLKREDLVKSLIEPNGLLQHYRIPITIVKPKTIPRFSTRIAVPQFSLPILGKNISLSYKLDHKSPFELENEIRADLAPYMPLPVRLYPTNEATPG